MDSSSDISESPAAKAVRLMGGPVSAARELGVDKYQTVQSWVKCGIPARYCARIEAITGVSRRVLRPDDWADYWPDAGHVVQTSALGVDEGR